MKYVSKSQAQKVSNGPTASVLEYLTDDPDIDGAVATVNGRYPASGGFVVNEACKELLYVLSGSSKLFTKETSIELNPGDQVLIDQGELFRYEPAQDLVLFAACTPARQPEQHKEVAGNNAQQVKH